MARKTTDKQYIVTASSITPGHAKGTVLTADELGDRLEKHLRTGAVEEYTEPDEDAEGQDNLTGSETTTEE